MLGELGLNCSVIRNGTTGFGYCGWAVSATGHFSPTAKSLLTLALLLALASYVLAPAYWIWNLGYRQGKTGSSIGKSVFKFKVVSETSWQPIGFGPSVDMIGRNMKGAAVYTGLRSRIRLGLNGIRLGWPHCRAAVRLPDGMQSLAVGLVALLLALAACGTVSGTATYTRDTRTISVESGERFTIKLNASPGIGDDWRIVGGLEHGRVKLVDESYQADDRGVPGGSGTASFLFEATQPGRTELTFFNCYRCAGADKLSPENAELAETLVFTITAS